MNVSVRLEGPLFDGQSTTVVRQIMEEAKTELGMQAMADVHQVLDARIKHPTPYYETQIETNQVGSDVVVDDRGVIYGPWLEGVSSRNKTTRFKGYRAFREAHQRLERKAPYIVERIVAKFLPRLGG